MDRDFKILFGVPGAGAIVALIGWAIDAGAFAAPPNYGWIYNYQTLIGVITALVAALITVYVMHHQGEVARADEADDRLTQYATALFDVTEKCLNLTPPDDGETPEAAQERLSAFQGAADSPTIKAAMMDGALGRDQPMIPLFLECCRRSALGRFYDRREARFENMVWPLYIALSTGLIRRKALLQSGHRVRELLTLSTIDQVEFQRAFVEGRAPNLG
jgi:hypothetical protein